jgi:hypothetical protein
MSKTKLEQDIAVLEKAIQETQSPERRAIYQRALNEATSQLNALASAERSEVKQDVATQKEQVAPESFKMDPEQIESFEGSQIPPSETPPGGMETIIRVVVVTKEGGEVVEVIKEMKFWQVANYLRTYARRSRDSESARQGKWLLLWKSITFRNLEAYYRAWTYATEKEPDFRDLFGSTKLVGSPGARAQKIYDRLRG